MFDFLIDIVPRLTGKSPVEVGKGDGGETEFEGGEDININININVTITGNIHSFHSNSSILVVATLLAGSNEIPTVNPQHGMMLQAITHHLQQDQMSQQLDPNLAAMMSGFEGGGAAGVGSGGLASEEEQRILMMQWQAAATQNLQADELKRKKADDDDE